MLPKIKRLLFALILVIPALSFANQKYTEVGLYGFASGIQGETQVGGLATDVNQSFSDILSHLDIGFMGLLEHRHHNWFFIGDLLYVKLSDDNARAFTPYLSINLEATLKQITAQGFIGYRIFEGTDPNFSLATDIFAGLRYNQFDIDLSAQANIFRTTLGTNGSRSKDWLDWVIAIREQVNLGHNWGLDAWLDYGRGSDSNSFQVAAFLNYLFENNIKLFLGYRLYHFEYNNAGKAPALNIDLDYKGPMLGISYRFS